MSKQQPKSVKRDKTTNAHQAPTRRVRYVRNGNGGAMCVYYPDKPDSQ